MNQTTETAVFEVHLPEPTLTKFERERRAFFRLLPQLLSTHRGQYVAIHDEQVVDSGPDQLEVALRLLRRVGHVGIYVHLVEEQPEQVYRSGVIRELNLAEANR